MSKYSFFLKRVTGYFLGFLLFYEPFMFFGKLLSEFFPETGFTSIHVPCARIPLTQLLTNEWQYASAVSLLFCLLLAVTSLWFGPLFCGRLCPAGAFSEFLGSLLPDKYKIDWIKYVPVVPVRYGFFVGFVFSAWLGFATPCIYCNYYALEIFVNGAFSGDLLNTSASLILTFIIANIFLGLLTMGGRGYCNFLCPVGAFSSLFHRLGQFLPGAFKMQISKNKCVGCGMCVKACPMCAVALTKRKAHINVNHCIVCGKCRHTCPKQAISYNSNVSREM